jgi:hypothetical protein
MHTSRRTFTVFAQWKTDKEILDGWVANRDVGANCLKMHPVAYSLKTRSTAHFKDTIHGTQFKDTIHGTL